ncbi:hypothetical protein MASR2M47_13100 [Draconibacterium sp.]
MRQFVIILFVLILVLAGKSHSQNILQKQIGFNSISLINGNLPPQTPITLQDFYYDGQDANDLDGFCSISDLPDSYHIFQHSEIISFAPVLAAKQLIQLSELLLDLPPPSLSV